MVAHTGFLIFGRRIEPADDPRAKALLAESGIRDEDAEGDIPESVDTPEEE